MFTLQAANAGIAYQNKAVLYDLLFKASTAPPPTIAANPKCFGARIGITSVLKLGLDKDPQRTKPLAR